MANTSRFPLALLCSLCLALALALPLVRATASPLLLEDYPPQSWSESSFAGVITSPPPPRGTKRRWITVRQLEGSEVQCPLDVHNQLPRHGEVRKRAGRVELESRDDPASPWVKVTPMDDSRRDFQLLLQWLAWSAALFTLFAGLCVALLRRQDQIPSSDPPRS